MKLNFFKVVFALLFVTLLISLFPKSSYALAPLDQYCSRGIAGSQTMVFTGNQEAFQVFTPTKNTLDAVSLRLRTEVGNSSRVKVTVTNATAAGQTYTIGEMTKTISRTESWVTFDFPDTPMPNGIYTLRVQSVDMPNQAIWKMSDDPSCDPRGQAVVNRNWGLNKDFGYGVYAYDSGGSNAGNNNPPVANPPANNPPTGNTNNNSSNGSTGASSSSEAQNTSTSSLGISRGSGQPPSIKTTSQILPPTNLKAKDKEFDYGGYIDLGWTASTTTDIDGYKVFRRAEGDPEYVEILRLPKPFTKFTDPWATKDKTYYYKIRAYKGAQESADSNVAFAASKDDLTGLKKDILDDYKKNAKGGVLGEAFASPILIIIPIVIILLIIGLFILGLWVLFHKKKQSTNPKQ